jgi:hypothetical protein
MLCVCLCITAYQLLNVWTNLYETWYLYNDNWAHLNGVLHKSLPSVCVSVCVSLVSLQGNGSVKFIPPFSARQRLGKHVPAAKNTSNNIRIVKRVISYAVRVLSQESLWVCPCIPLSLLGKDIPAATKDCWRRRFLCGPCRKKGKWVISSSQNKLLFLWLKGEPPKWGQNIDG